MFTHKPRGSDKLFVETELGIVTRRGEWFFITSDKLKEYVPGLLEVKPLEELIREAQAWVQSTSGLSITLLMILLLTVGPWLALGATVVFHVAWYLSKSAFVIRNMELPLRIVNSDGYQMLLSLAVLSLLALQGDYLALGVGIFFFFIAKLRLLDRLWRKTGLGSKKGMTLNDRVLKMVIIRHALHENVAPSEVRAMEERLMSAAFGGGDGDE